MLTTSLQRGKNPPPNEFPGYNTKLLMARLQPWSPWSFTECGVPIHCHYSQVHWSRIVVPVKVSSMGQIEVLSLLYYKLFNYVQIELLVLNSNAWNHLTVQVINRITWNQLTVCKQINSSLFKNCFPQTIHLQIIYIWYMYV